VTVPAEPDTFPKHHGTISSTNHAKNERQPCSKAQGTNRRTFLTQTAGLAALAAATGGPVSMARAANPTMTGSINNSSRKILVGAATAAYQIEGAAAEDGRKPASGIRSATHPAV